MNFPCITEAKQTLLSQSVLLQGYARRVFRREEKGGMVEIPLRVRLPRHLQQITRKRTQTRKGERDGRLYYDINRNRRAIRR